MLKTRVMLGLVILGLMVGGTLLWQSELEYGWKVFLAIVGSIPYLSACFMMAITFFALDAEGRIPRSSFVYRYLSRFYSEEPEYIRICPAFWIITWGVFLVFLAYTLLSLLIWAVGYGILVGYAPDTLINIGKFLGGATGIVTWFVVLVTTFVAGCCSLIDRIKSSVWQKLVSICGIYLFFFFLISPFILINVYSKRSGLYEALSDTVTIGAAIPLAIAAFCGAIAGTLYLAYRVFPWIGNSFIGKLLTGLYYKVCPVIPVEPKLQSASE